MFKTIRDRWAADRIRPENGARSQRGQSFAEVAIFLPIFLILLAGLVEVSHIVLTQNRVTTAARAASRFAANGGEDNGMWVVALNSVTQTMELTDDRWDMWSMRGTLRYDASINNIYWDSFTFTHIYGISNTQRYTILASSAVTFQQNILQQMLLDENGNPLPPSVAVGEEGLQVVGALISHDIESILGLNRFIGDYYAVTGVSVMRRPNTMAIVQTNGCQGVFPIALEEGVRSVVTFPNPSDYEYPTTNPPGASSFPAQPATEVGLDAAREGIAYLFEGLGELDRDFGFLSWDGAMGHAPLAESLLWPGNSDRYVQPGDASDTQMHIDNTVYANNDVGGQVKSRLNDHIDRKRSLRVIVFDDADNGPSGQYKIQRFAIFRLRGYNFSQGWLLAEFIRWDYSCGQIIADP